MNSIKVKTFVSINEAIRIYYTYPELGNKEIRELFGNLANSTISNYKKAVREVQTERNIKTSQKNAVNTEVAYEVWGIDVENLEQRRKKLKALGMSA
ncbi:MAG: hypothetical protein J1F01_00630 [Oscillospiraceae bacterium]|nr:hypothetical protein [Oscillospiraceae bacterium]